MRTTIPKLRRMIRKVIQEHVADEHHEHGEGSHEEEPYGGYVEAMAAAHVDEQRGGLDFDEYAEFAAQYGYTTEADLDQLEEWWEAAIEQSRGGGYGDRFGDGYAPAPHGERRNNSRFFNEAWSPERGFYAKEEDLPIYYEELEKLEAQGITNHMSILDQMVKAIEARGLRWDVHTFEEAYGAPA